MSSSQPKHQTPILIPPFIKITKEIGVGTVVQERALDGRGDPGGLESCASFTMFVGISVKLSTWMLDIRTRLQESLEEWSLDEEKERGVLENLEEKLRHLRRDKSNSVEALDAAKKTLRRYLEGRGPELKGGEGGEGIGKRKKKRASRKVRRKII